MRPRSGWQKWNSRLIAWGLVLTLLPVAGVAGALQAAYRRTASELIVERNLQLAYLSASRLADELMDFAGPLSALARTTEIYSRNVADQQAALQKAIPRLAAFDAGVVLLDSFGMVRASVPERPEILLQDWSNRRFFQGLLASSDVAFSDVLNDGPEGRTVTVIAVRILNDKGEFVGALAGMFYLARSTVSSFFASIVRLRIGQSGTTFLVDGSNRVLYDSDYAEIGAVFDRRQLPAGALQGIGGASRTRDPDGHQIVAAYVPVPRTGWRLIAEDDWATLTRTSWRYSNTLLALLAVGMILPAGGVALLVRQRHGEMHEKEEYEQARHVAGLIQQTLLPKHVPLLPGWNLTVHYQPAKTTSGDFYDYLLLPDGRLMLTVGDIGDNSVHAPLVTATARASLRGAARHSLPPAAALAQGNELLCPELQEGRSVSCVYSILEPDTGRFEFANAGEALAYHCGKGQVHALDSSGQPLGAGLGAQYQQSEVALRPGESMLFVTGGLISARNSEGEPFGAPRLKAVLERKVGCGQALADAVLSELQGFTGSRVPQEDDVTVMVLERTAEAGPQD